MSESAEHDDTVNELPGVPQVIRDAAKLSKGFNSMNLLGPAGKVAYEQIAKQLDTVAKITGETPKYPFATPVPHVLPAIDPQIIANSPEMRTARQTASMAEALDTMRGQMAALVDATVANVELSREARHDNREAQKATHRMSVASLWVAIGSLALAAVSVVTAIIALTAGR